MNVSLTPGLEEFVAAKVKSGLRLSSLDRGEKVDPEAAQARIQQRSRERRKISA